MSVMTVLGPVSTDDLGITLPHEHTFIDLRNQFTEFVEPEKRRISEEPVSLHNHGVLRRNPYAIKDNLVLDDLDLAVEELNRFGEAGGRTVVDCTSIGINRSPEMLREVALRTGLNIVAGCGYYTQDTHSADIESRSVEQVAETIIRDLTCGIDGTAVRAGVIGEIGVSDPVHPNEAKCLHASAAAAREVDVPIYVHTYPWGTCGIDALDILEDEEIDLQRVVICHIDVEFNLDYILAILKRGALVEFDDFGKEFYIDKADRGFAGGVFARDIERVRLIAHLVDQGFGRQILITNDICLKQMLHRYGGWGYDHILKNIVPMMLDEGISQDCIDLFLRENPRSLWGHLPEIGGDV